MCVHGTNMFNDSLQTIPFLSKVSPQHNGKPFKVSRSSPVSTILSSLLFDFSPVCISKVSPQLEEEAFQSEPLLSAADSNIAQKLS